MHKKQLEQIIMPKTEQLNPRPPADLPPWMIFLLYLAWLRAMRPQPPVTATVLRTLIIAVALVLVVVALVAAGAPEVVADVMQQWPLTP